ncbi:hypothetical protein G9A89_003403 [Geosiphon pyriformis]|nr:hypothetical protein G9A89_003403 [Geosiphon pyriformis]
MAPTQHLSETVTESEETRTNHLGFTKFLFQYYHTHLELTNNSWPTESAFNCYVNKKIVYYLGGQEDPKFVFNNFFSELLQSTILPQNYLFASLITEINRKIEKYTKQRFPITFADKGKGRLQTPVETPKQIQLSTWKKQRFNSSVNPSYHHTLGKITDLEKKKGNDQEISKQNPILENSEIETLQQQQSQLVPQQQLQQPLQQQSQLQQQLLLVPIAYAPITKIEKFTSKKDNAQRETETVITYLGHFYRNLCQIQAIQADYFTVPQILNQFIRGLCTTLQDTVTWTRDFKSAELETNHAQTINLVMNGLSDLNFKLKQLSDLINQKLKGYLADNCTIYQPF